MDRAGTLLPDPVVENIDAVLETEAAALQRRTRADRAADAIAGFVGSVPFVALHVAMFTAWAVCNTGVIPGLPRFDPYPFALLCMIVSFEGVLLSTFVLIKQNRMSYVADRRAHLDLQVNLLAEREITRLLQICQETARRLGVDEPGLQAGAFGETTEVGHLVGELDRRMSEER